MDYKLAIRLGDYPVGTKVSYDSEWNEWLVGSSDIYGYRGSIREGEFAMLLDYASRHKLTSILTPQKGAKKI